MNRALLKEMRRIREGMQAEKDPETQALMANMYRDFYGQAFRDEEAERPTRLTKKLVRSFVIYLLISIAVLAGLGYVYGTTIVIVGALLILGGIVAFSAIGMRTTGTISESTLTEIIGKTFTFISSATKAPDLTLPSISTESAALPQPVPPNPLLISADADPNHPPGTDTQET